MKKLILLVACAAFAFTASAQPEWGVKAGLNLANLTKSDGSMKPSFYVGAFAEFRINDYLGIQPEVMYSRQGSYDKEGSMKMWRRLNYINIPILAKIYLLENLSLDLGPQFGILLNAKLRYKNDPVLGGNGSRDIDDAKNFDVSIPIGLTYRIAQFDISARYILGLTEVDKTMDNKKKKNSVIQIGAGYRF